MIRISLIFILCFVVLTSKGQSIAVFNPKLEPIVAATVSNSSGEVWVTDDTGSVNVNIKTPQQLIIQHVSHQSKTVWFQPDQNLKVILQPSVKNLNELVVEGFTDNEKLSKMAGSIAKIEPRDLHRFDNFSLVPSVNTIPGVRFEQRAAASYRVSIRGSSIRSPFGVRNVKVYWNGIPFTEPGGNTFLNLLDLSNVGSLEIIKGPTGSAYGAGNGGTIKIESTNLSSLANATAFGTTIGSFGSLRAQLQSNILNDNYSLTAKYAFQTSEGYRDHNEMKRQVGEIDFLYFPDDDRNYSASLLFSDLLYEIPGGLNPTQLAENRRQARPGSEAFNASIDHQYFLAKVGQEYDFSETFRSDVNVSFYKRWFENPFNLDYKKDQEHGFGSRFELENDFRFLGASSQITYGNEFQLSYFSGKNFGNVGGEADTIRFSDKLQNQISIWFADVKLNLNPQWKLTLGASYNSLQYDINRLEDRINNAPGRVVKEFDGVFSPRIALSKTWSEKLNTHFSIAHGYSPPTTTEVRTNEGTINQSLQPEIGVNYELNFRGTLVGSRLSYDVALFRFKLDESITTETNNQGVVLFRNAGEVDQKGLEASILWNWLANESLTLEKLSTRLAYTHHDFEFRNYTDDGENYSGNALTGTAPNALTLTTDLSLKNGFYANLTYQFTDEIPLNDENTIYADSYQIIQTRLGYKAYGKNKDYEFYLGVDNLLNEEYSLGNDLNAFGQRYFQPAPTRNFYVGLNLKFYH